MMTDLEIWRAALLVTEQHGEGAAVHAARRADELLDEGDFEAAAVWRAIVRAIAELRCGGRARR